MFKRTFYLLFILLIAQYNVRGQTKFGVMTGPNITRLFDFARSSEYGSEYNAKFGFDADLFYKFKVDSQLFQATLGYRFRNFDLHVFDGGNKNLEYETHQIFGTLYLNERIYTSKKIELYFLIGPSINILLNSNVEGDGWEDRYQIVYDSLHTPHYNIIQQEIVATQDDKKSVSIFALELSTGMDLYYAYNPKMKFILGGYFNIGLPPSFIVIPGLKYTSSMTGILKTGIEYEF